MSAFSSPSSSEELLVLMIIQGGPLALGLLLLMLLRFNEKPVNTIDRTGLFAKNSVGEAKDSGQEQQSQLPFKRS